VSLETEHRADVVALNWACQSCRQEWPVTVADQIERRRNAPERRQRPRSDRRKP
jgi:hypothetical protein